jgi:hypothetical protein
LRDSCIESNQGRISGIKENFERGQGGRNYFYNNKTADLGLVVNNNHTVPPSRSDGNDFLKYAEQSKYLNELRNELDDQTARDRKLVRMSQELPNENQEFRDQVKSIGKMVEKALLQKVKEQKKQSEITLEVETAKFVLKTAVEPQKRGTQRPFSSTNFKIWGNTFNRKTKNELDLPEDTRTKRRIHHSKISQLLRKTSKRVKKNYLKHRQAEDITVNTELESKRKLCTSSDVTARKKDKFLYESQRAVLGDSGHLAKIKSKNNGMQYHPIEKEALERVHRDKLKTLFSDPSFQGYVDSLSTEFFRNDEQTNQAAMTNLVTDKYSETGPAPDGLSQTIETGSKNDNTSESNSQRYAKIMETLVLNNQLFSDLKEIDYRKGVRSGIPGPQPNTTRKVSLQGLQIIPEHVLKRKGETSGLKTERLTVSGPVAYLDNVDPKILADRIKFSAFIQGAPNSIKHDLLQLNNKNKVNINQYNVFDNLDLPESLIRKLNRNTESNDRTD